MGFLEICLVGAPFAILFASLVLLIFKAIVPSRPSSRPSAHEVHAARLYCLNRQNHESWAKRISSRLRDRRDWREEFKKGIEWWYSGSLIAVEMFDS
ncbi:hypothetical protein F9947_18130 [Burkholderia thailandensis]|nr:hypothetical protein [Burkholderia thailandensis]